MSQGSEHFVRVAMLLADLRLDLYRSYLLLEDFDRQPWAARIAGLPAEIEEGLRQLADRIANVIEVACNAEAEAQRGDAFGVRTDISGEGCAGDIPAV